MSAAPRPVAAALMPRVALLGHRGMPWAYPPSRDCIAAGGSPPDWPSSSFLAALEQRHARDTWFQALTVPEARWARLSKGLLREIGDWAGVEPVLSLAVLDLDRTDHHTDPWPDTATADSALRATLTLLSEHGWGGAWGYATRGGLRVGWVLAEPVPLVHAQSFLNQLHAAMPSELPVDRDPKVKDWTRGFRLPWCPRADGCVPAWGDAAPPMEIDALRAGRTLVWRPSELTEETVHAARERVWWEKPTTPTDADKRIGPAVEKWAREISEAKSRHGVLLEKGRALGGLCQGAADRGIPCSPPSHWAPVLIAAGGDSNDAEAAVWDSIEYGANDPWWFEERPLPEPPNLRQAMDQWNHAMASPATDDQTVPGRSDTDAPKWQSFADVKAEPIDWAWKDRIPFGMVTLLEGNTTAGKTTLACDLTAHWTKGGDPGYPREPLRVLWLSKEDSPAHMIKPRFEAAGVVVENVIRPHEGVVNRFPDDLPKVRALVRELGVRLVVIDPLNSYFTGDSNSEIEVRNKLMDPLNVIAREHGLAVLAMRHLGKSSGEKQAIHRGLGSAAYMAGARAAFLLATDPEDSGGRILACTKLQVARNAPSLSLRLVDHQGVGRIEWGRPVDVSADDLGQGGDDGTSLTEAVEWLQSRLGSGPVETKTCYREAAKDGISDRTLRRAKGKLGARHQREDPVKRTGPWMWVL